MLDILTHADTSLMLWLNGFHNSFWDIFMYIVTNKWTWIPMYCAILYVLLKKYGCKTILLWIILMFAVTITLSDQTCGSLIRHSVARMRPSNLENPISNMIHIVNGYRGGRYGFPSCHAANSFALATLLFLFFRNRRLTIFIFLWAVLNSYSRIYVGVHYPGDLLAGAMVGATVAFIVYSVFYHFLRLGRKETYKQIYIISDMGFAIIAVIVIFSTIKIIFF